jgi:hypothetical protein
MARRDNVYGLKVDLLPDDEAIVVTVRKRDGEDFVEVESETFAVADVDGNLRANVLCYGLSKLLQDRVSDTDAGPDKLTAMREVMSRLTAGEWEKERAVGAPTVSAEVEAVAQLKGIGIPQAQKALRALAADVREKVINNPKVKELAAKIKAEREASESVDVADLAA